MLKEKNYDKKDVLDESLVIANVREMSRKELEQFADRMRIDRNSFLIQDKIQKQNYISVIEIEKQKKQLDKVYLYNMTYKLHSYTLYNLEGGYKNILKTFTK